MPENLEILINVTSFETRVAVLEAGVVQELTIERSSTLSLVGNIYKAKVVRVIPGMQAAFVDIGLDKKGFLHIDDFENNHQNSLTLQDQLHQGEVIWVQVTKDPYSDKGARLTTRLSISTRNLVYLPLSSEIGVSQKITSNEEKKRLVKIINQLCSESTIDGGFIVRTSAENIESDALLKELLFLQQAWHKISDGFKANKSISLVYKEPSLLIRTLREADNNLIDGVRIDSLESLNLAEKFIKAFCPELQTKIVHYIDSKPLFDLYSVEQQIKAVLNPVIKLASGAHLVIESTTAMTVIDVNTSSFIGNKNQSETILKVNIEAAKETARQIRLRNLCGIIIIDFIDMIEVRDRKQVLEILESSLAKDRVKTKFSNFSSLGLVEISRQRTSESLEQIICEKCSACDGNGSVPSNQTLSYDILRDILRQHTQFKPNSYTITTSSEIVEILEGEEAESLSGLEKLLDVPIKLIVDQHCQQQYNIALN